MGKFLLSCRVLSVAVVLLGTTTFDRTTVAADKLRVGKAAATAFTFIPLDVGIKEGIFAKHGLEVESIDFTGDAKLQQALTSETIDFALGSGPGMAFAAKGAPVRAVAAYFGAPANIAVTVKEDSPIKTVSDLKGKVIAVSTVGSLTDWLTKQIAIQEGWGQDAIRIVATGAGPAMTSAIIAGSVDAGMGSYETALALQQEHRARPLVTMDKYAPHFITHVIFARQSLIGTKPDEVGKFVRAFFAALDYMRAHRETTIDIADEVIHEGKAVFSEAYDREMPLMSMDGSFDPVALKIIKDSWVSMNILDTMPSDDQILTRRFVPVKVDEAAATAK